VEHGLSESRFSFIDSTNACYLTYLLSLHIKKPGDDDAEIYVTKDVAATADKKHLTRAGFLLTAILHGADYDTVSLPKFALPFPLTNSSFEGRPTWMWDCHGG